MRDTQENFHKKFLGKIGENKATRFLKKSGYKIIERNYKNHVGEIDIIAKKKDTLVFVEVKTRVSDLYGRPSEAVGKEKQRKIITVAKEFLMRKEYRDIPCRFDVIEVEKGKINHILDAFTM